jgi:RNA polymerase sigma-70 factor (ECF subfamily)
MEESARNGDFPATCWTAVWQLRAENSISARSALAQLCENYWFPLYAFARRQGCTAHDAEDLTQGFFYYAVERDLFAAADPDLGRLRTFLLTAFRRYLADERTREGRQKRGGNCEKISVDFKAGEEQYFAEFADHQTPEKLYERSWALSVLSGAMSELATREAEAGREKQFDALSPFLTPGEEDGADYATVARGLAITEEAARQAVSRLRRRFREALRVLVADTLLHPTEQQIDQELGALRAALQ